MTLQTLTCVGYIQTVLSAVVAFLALIRFKSREIYVKLIGLIFLLSFMANVAAYILYYLGLKFYTNIPQSIYEPIMIGVVSILYYQALNKRYSRFFLIVTVCSIAFAVFNLFFLQKQSISSYPKFVNSFIIIGYCIFYFYRLMVELPSTNLQRLPMFWFNSAFLIYFAGALILFIFTSYIVNILKDNLITYWVFHNTLSICEHLIVLTGLYFNLKYRGLQEITL